MRCIELALKNPPARGARVEIFNQMTETHRVRDLAEMIARMSGAKIAWLPNPRKEAAENDLIVKNEQIPRSRPEPDHAGRRACSAEIVDVGRKKFAYRVDRSRVPAVSAWTRTSAGYDQARPGRQAAEIGVMTADDAPACDHAPTSRHAYVTLVTNADYAWARWRLPARCGAPGPRRISSCCTPAAWRRRDLAPLDALGCRLIEVEHSAALRRLQRAHARDQLHGLAPFTKGRKPAFHSPLDNFCKLRLWQLREYERVRLHRRRCAWC